MKDDQGWLMCFPSKREVIELRERLPGELRQPLQALSFLGRKEEEEPWSILGAQADVFALRHELWLDERSRQAMIVLRDYVETSPRKLGGVPLFRGTRFSIPQFFAELADSDVIVEIAENFEVNEATLRGFLHAFAVYLNRPVP